jgi:hypothetical protein
MKFKSRVGVLIQMTTFGLNILFIYLLSIVDLKQANEVVSLIVLFAFAILFFWILFNTSYLIENGSVHYKSGPVKGRIEIDSIRKIKMNANLYSGLKPALAFKGIIVYYGKYDEIYFSPKTNASFVDELLKINNSIVIQK